MHEELKDIFFYTLNLRDIIRHLMVSLACGALIAVVYRLTYKGLSYSATFVNSVMMLTMVTTLVIMVIGNNLATAFGLVGAMSIIRFRTAVKDTQDIIFIFMSLAVGLACGAGLFQVAIFGTIIIGIVFYAIVKINLTAPRKRDFLLQMIIRGNAQRSFDASDVLNKYCRKYHLVNVKAVGEDQNNLMELSYYVKLSKEENSKNLVAEIKEFEGVQHVNLFFDEE